MKTRKGNANIILGMDSFYAVTSRIDSPEMEQLKKKRLPTGQKKIHTPWPERIRMKQTMTFMEMTERHHSIYF